jgi:hypothetical protein
MESFITNPNVPVSLIQETFATINKLHEQRKQGIDLGFTAIRENTQYGKLTRQLYEMRGFRKIFSRRALRKEIARQDCISQRAFHAQILSYVDLCKDIKTQFVRLDGMIQCADACNVRNQLRDLFKKQFYNLFTP